MGEGMENFNVEIKLPDEVMVHLRNAAKELLKGEFEAIRILYGDNLDNFDTEELIGILASKMIRLIDEVYDEVEEEFDD